MRTPEVRAGTAVYSEGHVFFTRKVMSSYVRAADEQRVSTMLSF